MDIETLEKGKISFYADSYSTVVGSKDSIFIVVDGSRSGLAVLGVDGAVGSTIMCLTPISVNNKYLYFFIKFNYDYFNNNTIGSSIPHLDLNLFNTLEVPLPPIDEQNRIVVALEIKLAEHKSQFKDAENEINKMRDYRKAMLDQAFSGNLTSAWRKENNAPEWIENRLDELFMVETGGTPSRSNNLYWSNGKINWVKSGEVNNGDIVATSEYITELAIKETNAKLFPIGTILIAMYGEGKTRGQTGILRIEAATNQAVAALVNNDIEEVTRKYVYFFIRSQYEKLRSQADGTAQANLNLSIIKSWLIKMPSVEEQEIIVQQLEQTFSSAEILEQKQSKILQAQSDLEKSVLQLAFQGKLSESNTNDEPISKLLLSIDSERKRIDAQIKEAKKLNAENLKSIKRKLDDNYIINFIQENFQGHTFTATDLLEKLGINGGKEYIKVKEILFSLLQEQLKDSDPVPFLESVYDKSNKQIFKIKE